MNVSAVNCTPIKPQVSFGQDQDFSDAQRVLDMSKELSDSFAKEDGQKSKLQTIASIGGALATTCILGRAMAGKLIDAGVHTKLASFGKTVLAKAKDIKAPNFVKNVKFPEKVQKGIAKIAENPKVKNTAAVVVDKATKLKSSAQTYIAEHGAEKIIKDTAGLASMAVFGTQIAKVDGNGDGIADIAQKNVNAYQNAVRDMGVVGEIAKALV